MYRRCNKYSKITAPCVEYQIPDGIITTLHPEGSLNNIQFGTEKNRTFVRPKINYMIVIINVLIPLIVCLIVCWWNVFYAFIGFGIYFLIRLRKILVFFIHVYQRYASDDIRGSCVFEPSCSEYMILSIEKYGVFYGSVKGIKRLKRCHLPNGGEDYP